MSFKQRRRSLDGSGGPAAPATPSALGGPGGTPLARQLSGSVRRGVPPDGGGGYEGGPPGPYGGPYSGPHVGLLGGGYGPAGVRLSGTLGSMAGHDHGHEVGWHGAALASRHVAERPAAQRRHGYGGYTAAVGGLRRSGSLTSLEGEVRWEARQFRKSATMQEEEWAGIKAGLAQFEAAKPSENEPPPLAPQRARNAAAYLLRRVWYLYDSRLAKLWFQTANMLVVAVAVVLGAARFFLWQLGGSEEMQAEGMDGNFTEWTWNTVFLFLSNGYGMWASNSPEDVGGRISTTVIIIFAILYLNVIIAVIVSAVQIKMRALKYGLSPVVESGHTVVLGFNASVLSIIRELCLANESEGGGVVAVLERGNTIEMAAELAAFMGKDELKGTKVVFRNGMRLRLADLEFVAVPTARAIIAVADQRRDADTADAEMLQVMLNLSGMQLAEGAAIAAEVRDVDSTDFIQQVASAVSASLTSHDIVGSLLLFFVRQPGLVRVYNAVLGFTGSEFYVARWPELTGRRWSEVTACFPDAVPIGLRRPDGSVLLNPQKDMRCTEHDELIVLAEDNDTYRCEAAATLGERRAAPPRAVEAPLPEVLLLLGWRRDLPRMLELLDRTAPPLSELHIVCDLTLLQREEELAADGLGVLHNVTLIHHVGSTTSRRTLKALPLEYATSALIMAAYDERTRPAHSDSRALATLTLLKRMHAEVQALARIRPPRQLPIVVQILDPRTQRTVDASTHVWRSADFVLSNELTSKMLAMISEDLSVKSILEALVGEADTYLSLMHPSECLPARARHGAVGGGPGGGAASFWELSRECTLEHDATLIGYIPDDDPRDPHAEPPCCIINPEDKVEQRTWTNLRLVVIKRDRRLQPPPERANSPGILGRSPSPVGWAPGQGPPSSYEPWQDQAVPQMQLPQQLRSRRNLEPAALPGAVAWSPNALYEPHLVAPASSL